MSDATTRDESNQAPHRRDVLLGGTALATASVVSVNASVELAQAQPRPAPGGPPNIVYFLVDNLGYGELGCYGGGILRGADTRRIDTFATEGIKLLNFAPEAQCTPSRAALMTGRYAIRSGNHTVAVAGDEGGLVAWEKTMGDILSARGYATACVGKWHIGDSAGRWPTDHGFDEWYGPPRTWDEALWPTDPWYDPTRDGVSSMMESRRGQTPRAVKQLTLDVRRDVDREFLDRGKAFMRRSVEAGKPFFLYFNHSLMHLPTIPRAEFKARSGQGEWADCLLQLDSDFGELLDTLRELKIDDNTIVVFSGDNGPEEMEPWRGHPGFFDGSYFTGMEGSLRTPCLVRYPGRVPAGRQSNDVVHITDMFPTLLQWAGATVPADRVIDGVDQRTFLEGRQEHSARDGFPYWMGETMYGVKWRNFKMVMYLQKTLTDPSVKLMTPHVVNLTVDPKERKPIDYPYIHSWTAVHFGRILRGFQASVGREPLIPAGAPLDHVPARS
ncbi:MAG: arylsulfatase [Reyranella sp.]|uniref:arylsulfatase n=1 Tax=Reyranella sp. TaxID=1929291 RepID=UPI001AC46A08|nr:arylsulfatase [Reyranella sp.]MBN9088038.1 arylsulfatase [Reyranella sp.]